MLLGKRMRIYVKVQIWLIEDNIILADILMLTLLLLSSWISMGTFWSSCVLNWSIRGLNIFVNNSHGSIFLQKGLCEVMRIINSIEKSNSLFVSVCGNLDTPTQIWIGSSVSFLAVFRFELWVGISYRCVYRWCCFWSNGSLRVPLIIEPRIAFILLHAW